MGRVDPDRINNADAAVVQHLVMDLVDRLQTHEPGAQVHTATALFILVAEWAGVPPQELFTATKNLMSSTEGNRTPAFAAIAAYLANEVPRG
ncbi:hypothetical protein AncyloWKF20_07655 [Ancylobacter sp. WKF20]|uniref:hypothetical protein n=1 Tax=Ancylobacter sp. WKF20 TaxID=3039801 RepID=UPI002434346B|nr:hypothetical protein [Ancylobacter sp. WKF20]WGD31685.1 hypothetical protein AncyloWKF20_07655 [Ancylobacter sp. WKF20]